MNFVVICILASGVMGDKDPFDGVWTMNAAKSKYAAGNVPKGMTIRMETGAEGVHYNSETT